MKTKLTERRELVRFVLLLQCGEDFVWNNSTRLDGEPFTIRELRCRNWRHQPWTQTRERNPNSIRRAIRFEAQRRNSNTGGTIDINFPTGNGNGSTFEDEKPTTMISLIRALSLLKRARFIVPTLGPSHVTNKNLVRLLISSPL